MHPNPPLAQLESVTMLIPTAASPSDTVWLQVCFVAVGAGVEAVATGAVVGADVVAAGACVAEAELPIRAQSV